MRDYVEGDTREDEYKTGEKKERLQGKQVVKETMGEGDERSVVGMEGERRNREGRKEHR